MYGTVSRARIKPGSEDKIVELFEEWQRDYRPTVKGAMHGYLYRKDNDPNEIIMVAVFEDKASYMANASDPSQDAWYKKFREQLEGDPVWEDGEIIAGS